MKMVRRYSTPWALPVESGNSSNVRSLRRLVRKWSKRCPSTYSTEYSLAYDRSSPNRPSGLPDLAHVGDRFCFRRHQKGLPLRIVSRVAANLGPKGPEQDVDCGV